MISKRGLRGHLSDLAIGLLLTGVLLALGELALRAFDLADPGDQVDLSRGFDPRAAYVVPDPEVPGGWVTQFAEGHLGEVRIPPRTSTPDGGAPPSRVLLFGGSNTDNFPDGRLERLLQRDGAAWEVINLGRSGYGSARVSILFEQALERLDPDVVVLYSGHNEFVEQSFERDLQAEWTGDLGLRLGRWAASSRVVTGVRQLFDDPPGPSGKRPEAWKWEYDKFKGLTYAETLEVYDRYRDNLALMCSMAIERDVGVVLCTVVHNHFAAPFESTLPADWTPDRTERFDRLRNLINRSFPSWLRPLSPLRARDRVIGMDWRASPEDTRDPPLPPEDLGGRVCFGPLATAPAKRTKARRWSEKTWQLLEALEQLKVRDVDPERDVLERLELQLEEALKICPDHPLSHFELGLVRLALGQDRDQVAPHLEAAARYDRAPRRGNGATNDRVRKVAADHDGVVLLDAEELFASRMPMGLVGWEWMSDHCHLNPGACLVFMSDLASVLEAHWP